MADPQKLCKSCAFFEMKAQECRRYAPKPVNVDDQKKMRWPATPPIGWCGQWSDQLPAEKTAPAPEPAPAAKPAAPTAKPSPPAAK